jgi:hypothetical protein
LIGTLFLFPLPSSLNFRDNLIAPTRFRTFLRTKYNIEVVVIAEPPQGYVRVSCQIYNTLHDFEKLRDAVLDICAHSKFTENVCSEIESVVSDCNSAPPGMYTSPTPKE